MKWELFLVSGMAKFSIHSSFLGTLVIMSATYIMPAGKIIQVIHW